MVLYVLHEPSAAATVLWQGVIDQNLCIFFTGFQVSYICDFPSFKHRPDVQCFDGNGSLCRADRHRLVGFQTSWAFTPVTCPIASWRSAFSQGPRVVSITCLRSCNTWTFTQMGLLSHSMVLTLEDRGLPHRPVQLGTTRLATDDGRRELEETKATQQQQQQQQQTNCLFRDHNLPTSPYMLLYLLSCTQTAKPFFWQLLTK